MADPVVVTEMSILESVKVPLGMASIDTTYDIDIIAQINMALVTLNQLGAGPSAALTIFDATAKWKDFSSDMALVSLAWPYTIFKARMGFDPPASPGQIDSLKNVILEIEHRILAMVDVTPVVVDPDISEE